MASLDFIKFHDGNKAPWLGYGTGTALYMKDATDAVSLAIKYGFRHLDGAQMYQNEDSLGKAVKQSGVPRSEFFITTKLAALPSGETVVGSLKDSLKKLDMEYVDLFLIHVPEQHPDLKKVWLGMVEAKKAGLTKSIGVSNFNIKQLEEIISTNTEIPTVNQIEYHPFLSTKMQPLIAFHAKHNIITESYAGLTPLISKRTSDPSLEAHRDKLFEVVDKLSAARGPEVTQNQILMKWSQQKGILTVTTSSKESRIKEYLATQSLTPLSDAEIASIDDAVKGTHLRVFKNANMDQL